MKMSNKQETLPVLFRKAYNEYINEWEVVAFFPTEVGSTQNPYWSVVGYMHVGQHFNADKSWYGETKKATPEEYESLFRELQDIYEEDDAPVKLKVVHKWTQQYDRIREEFWDQSRGINK
jgi:hypothetical protein